MAVPRPGWAPHLAAGAAFEPAALAAESTLVAAWRSRWREAPDRPVLHGDHQGWVTGADLDARSAGIARALIARHALAPGDRVLLSGASSIDLALVHVALLRAGAIVVPVNGAYRAAELAHIVGDCRPRLAVSDNPAWTDWAREWPAQNNTSVLSIAEVASARSAEPIDLDTAGPASPALIGYTSGTTGRPKGAVLTQANLLASVAALRLAWRWQPDDRLVLCLPLFHAHGLCVGLHGTLLVGASAVLVEGFDPDRVVGAITTHGATLFFGVPTMYHRFAGSPRVHELARLRLCVAGSAALPAALHVELAARAGQSVLERYGMTETVMLVSNPYDGERRPGSVGFPLPGVELAFARGEHDRVDLAGAATDGLVGEILVRGPNVFGGYWERPDANAAAFTDSWFRTGDLGTVSADGYVSIVGRAKELIISGGYNVYPREIEDVVATHPAVAEVAVVGTPSTEWGEEVTACVVLAPGAAAPSLDELRAFCRDSLANFKLPRRLHVVDVLPRNALGKVVKHELAAAVEKPAP